MDTKLRKKIEGFVRENIVAFHDWRTENVSSITLKELISNKNPYLFRAKNLNVAAEFIAQRYLQRGCRQRRRVSSEYFWRLAIFVAESTRRGQKSGIEGIDIELPHGGVRYLIAVKSARTGEIRPQLLNRRTTSDAPFGSLSSPHVRERFNLFLAFATGSFGRITPATTSTLVGKAFGTFCWVTSNSTLT